MNCDIMINHYLFEDVKTKVIGRMCTKKSHRIFITLQIALVQNFLTTFIFHRFANTFLIKHLWYMYISFLRKKTRILFSTSVILFTRTFHWYLNFEIILMNKFIKKLCVIKLLNFLFIWKGNIKIIYRNVLDLDISNICSMKLWLGFAYFVKFCHCVLMKI